MRLLLPYCNQISVIKVITFLSGAAKEIYGAMYPDEPFLSRAPDPEEILLGGEEESEQQQNSGGSEKSDQPISGENEPSQPITDSDRALQPITDEEVERQPTIGAQGEPISEEKENNR